MSKKIILLPVGTTFLATLFTTSFLTTTWADNSQTAPSEHSSHSANGSAYSHMPKKKLPDSQMEQAEKSQKKQAETQKQKAGQAQLEEEQRMDEGHGNAD